MFADDSIRPIAGRSFTRRAREFENETELKYLTMISSYGKLPHKAMNNAADKSYELTTLLQANSRTSTLICRISQKLERCHSWTMTTQLLIVIMISANKRVHR